MTRTSFDFGRIEAVFLQTRGETNAESENLALEALRRWASFKMEMDSEKPAEKYPVEHTGGFVFYKPGGNGDVEASYEMRIVIKRPFVKGKQFTT